MTDEEKKILLEKLLKEKEKSFSDSTVDAPAISQIVSQVNSLPKADRVFFKEFATNLKEELFSKSITIKGLNLALFNNGQIETSDFDLVSQESQLSKVKIEFEELFKKLTQNRPDHFEILKGYFIVKLENDPLISFNLMVLFDSSFFIQPIKKKIIGVIPDATFKTIEEYENEIVSNKSPESNLLCLILLQTRVKEEAIENLKKTLSSIFNTYKYFETFSLKNSVESDGNYHESSISKEDFFEEISYVIGTSLSNGSLNNEEEKIIKKLCSSFRTPLVIYKTLGGGNSGSKVIEIRPKKELGSEYEKRYIIKYSAKTDERKIRKEYDYFGKFIEGYKGFTDYECKYEKTLIYEGLRYSYAISDKAANSYSYKEILNNNDNVFYNQKDNIIDDLYSIGLFETWRDSIELIETSPSKLYNIYIDVRKILSELEKILDKTPSEIISDPLVVNFFKIWEKNYQFHQKICHGDLHTENFFKDVNGVYLIDFGYTGIRHAVIDYTSLECSIKFKHCPFYVGIEELKTIENELLSDSSFQLSYRFASTKRSYLSEMLEIIKKIRINSLPLLANKTSTIEYLISLFLMTFRQIRYKDMNQLYAYHSALIISEKIVRLTNTDI